MALIASLEDDPYMARMLGEIVRGAGWEWRLLSGGPETIGAIREFRPDIVTTGNRHPVLPGLQFLRAMKRDPALQDIPVVFVTARVREDLWPAIRDLGLEPDVDVAGLIEKPFDSVELVAELRRVLEATREEPAVGS